MKEQHLEWPDFRTSSKFALKNYNGIGIRMIQITLVTLLVLISTLIFAEDRVSLSSDKNDAEAVCVNNVDSMNECFILVDAQKYDISQVETANLGKLGLGERGSYSKVINIPTKWLHISNDIYIVEITTQAWFEGKRYTVAESALVKGGVYNHR